MRYFFGCSFIIGLSSSWSGVSSPPPTCTFLMPPFCIIVCIVAKISWITRMLRIWITFLTWLTIQPRLQVLGQGNRADLRGQEKDRTVFPVWTGGDLCLLWNRALTSFWRVQFCFSLGVYWLSKQRVKTALLETNFKEKNQVFLASSCFPALL